MAFSNLKRIGHGVFYRTKPNRKRKNRNRLDRQLILIYILGGKKYRDVYGWESDGYNVADAENKINEYKHNYQIGEIPICWAEEKEANRLIQEAKRKALEHKKMTISLFFYEHYLPQAKVDKREQTWKTEERLFRLWIEPIIGKLQFDELGIEHLNIIKNNMAKGNRLPNIKIHRRDKKNPKINLKRTPPRPLAPKTIIYALGVIRQIWNHAKDCSGEYAKGDWIGRKKSFKKPKGDNRRQRFLSKSEAQILLHELKKASELMHDLAFTSLHTGMRAGELFNLTWRTVCLEKGEATLFDTKNGESRTVFFTDQVVEILRKRLSSNKSKIYVFTNNQGNPLTQVPASFPRVVKRIELNKGITDPRQRVVFHTLRHTFASWLAEGNINLRTIGELLGHKTMVMTVRYSHIGKDAQKNAVHSLSDAINS